MKLIDYIYGQLERVHPFPIGSDYQKTVSIKLSSEHGKTNFIDITESQYREIQQILLTVNEFERV